MRKFRKTFTVPVYGHKPPFYIEQLVWRVYPNRMQAVEAKKRVLKGHATHKNSAQCVT
jgi:hypothetical protein